MVIDMKKILKHSSYVSVIFILLLILATDLYSAVNIRKINNSPEKRLMIYFDELPEKYTSELSEDKKKISIQIQECTVPEGLRNKSFSGIYNEIYIRQKESDCEISILLNEKRGYTAILQKWSRALMVEVFTWNNLTPVQDHYRTAQLAMMDGIDSKSEEELEIAASFGHIESTALLGLLKLKKGDIEESSRYIHKALVAKTDIPDTYAAAAQLLKKYGFDKRSDFFGGIFKDLTGVKKYPEISPITGDSSYTERAGEFVRAIFDDPALSDTVFSITIDTAKADSSEDSRFAKLFDRDSVSAGVESSGKDYDESEPSPFVPDWFGKIIVYIIGFIVFVAIAITAAYLRWRKGRMKKLYDTMEEPFAESRYNTRKAAEIKAAQAYREEQKKKTQEKIKAREAEMEKKYSNKPDPDKLSEILEKMRADKEREEIAAKRAAKNKIEDNDPKSRLAMKLNRQKKENLNKNIQEFDFDKDKDSDNISHSAKKIGVEKSGIEMRRKLKDLEKDSGKKSELERKFSVKKKKK